MDKIDNSTYKLIKKDQKDKQKSQKGRAYYKGCYGHSKRYKNFKIFMTLLIFTLILSDVVFSLIIFQTRKTIFAVIGCVLSIPFARNLIDLFMALKSKPLSQEDYKMVSELETETGRAFIYDISITDTDGMVYIPCAVIYNNNILCFTPEEEDTKQREKIKKYISAVNVDSKNYRIFVTEKFSTFSKEVKKLKDRDESVKYIDEEVTETILSMGF